MLDSSWNISAILTVIGMVAAVLIYLHRLLLVIDRMARELADLKTVFKTSNATLDYVERRLFRLEGAAGLVALPRIPDRDE